MISNKPPQKEQSKEQSKEQPKEQSIKKGQSFRNGMKRLGMGEVIS